MPSPQPPTTPPTCTSTTSGTECGSRWLESGVPLHHIQELLGHADLKTTSIYLNATVTGLHDGIRRFDAARQLCKKDAISAQTAPPAEGTEAEGTRSKSLIN